MKSPEFLNPSSGAPKYSDEPLRYMACIKLHGNGFITISRKLAIALALEGDTEFVRFLAYGDTEPAPILIARSTEHLSLGTAWRQPDGSYIIQRDNRQALPCSVVTSMADFFGLTMVGSDRYLSAKTTATIAADQTEWGFAVKRFIKK